MKMENAVFLRFVELGDMLALYKWRNDPLTMENSFNRNKVGLKDHIRWFKNSIKDSRRNIFIMVDRKGRRMGQLRFDRKGKGAEVGITIAPEFRGQGLGTWAIKMGCQIYIDNFNVSYIIAKVKISNPASLKIFTKSGFRKYKQFKEYLELRRERV